MADDADLFVPATALSGIPALADTALAFGATSKVAASILIAAAYRVLAQDYPAETAAAMVSDRAEAAIEGVAIAKAIRADLDDDRAAGRRPN